MRHVIAVAAKYASGGDLVISTLNHFAIQVEGLVKGAGNAYILKSPRQVRCTTTLDAARTSGIYCRRPPFCPSFWCSGLSLR